MHRPAVSLRLASAPATVTVTTGRGNLASASEVGAANAPGEAVENRFARKSLFRLAAAWRACPKAEAGLPDDGAGPLFQGGAENENEPVAVVHDVRRRSISR
jgi:hypothetical protein